jgi:ankyrin repeat protein
MSNSSKSLFKAILQDDCARVKALLKGNPRLAVEAVATEPRLALELPHWIYVGDTALHAAAAGYRVEIAKMLLAAGADVNAAGNHRRSAPLHYAADGSGFVPKRQVAMIRLLLDAGADIHAQDKNGATALHRAVRTRCAAAVKYLLDAGADATIRNLPGSTAFHLAVQNTGRGGSGTERAKAAQREIIREFLERGVSTGLKDANGKSVRQWAKSDSIRQILSSQES